MIVQPKQKSAFCRITNSLDCFSISEIKVSSGIDGNTFFQERRELVITQLLVFQLRESSSNYLHLVLSKCTGLIGTDNRYSTHSFASMHRTRQSVLLHQSLHAESKAECDCHRKTFRHGNYDKGNGNHYRVERILDELRPLFSGHSCTIDKIENDTYNRKYHESENLPKFNAFFIVIILFLVKSPEDNSGNCKRAQQVTCKCAIIRLRKNKGMTYKTAQYN